MPCFPLPVPAHAPPLPPAPSEAAAAPIRSGRAVMRPPRGFHSKSLPLPPDGSRNFPGPRHSGAFTLPAHSPGPSARGAPRRAPLAEGPGVPEENAEEPRNSPVPLKMKRGDGEKQRRPGGAENTERLEEAHGAIPPASGTCHRTRAPGRRISPPSWSGKLQGERCSLSEPSLPAGGDRPSAPFPDPPLI